MKGATGEKVVIDAEDVNEAVSFLIFDDGHKQVEVVLAGKIIVPVPKEERGSQIYTFLQEECGLTFCTTQKKEEFHFYPMEQFAIFAVDSQKGCYGTIGGIGDLEDDTLPVGYVTADGRCGRVAGNLKEFLSLAVFYPNWRKIFGKENKAAGVPALGEQQMRLAEMLGLRYNSDALMLVRQRLATQPGFMVYHSKGRQISYEDWLRAFHSLSKETRTIQEVLAELKANTKNFYAPRQPYRPLELGG